MSQIPLGNSYQASVYYQQFYKPSPPPVLPTLSVIPFNFSCTGFGFFSFMSRRNISPVASDLKFFPLIQKEQHPYRPPKQQTPLETKASPSSSTRVISSDPLATNSVSFSDGIQGKLTNLRDLNTFSGPMVVNIDIYVQQNPGEGHDKVSERKELTLIGWPRLRHRRGLPKGPDAVT